MIPKKIHYCWFGKNEKPELIKKCIASWKEKCPDYEIIEWNEDNFDVSSMPYTREAYAAGKWAFVSDVVRLYAVYHEGGVYLDTDVELLQNIDVLLEQKLFFVFESEINIATGLAFGSEKQHPYILEMLNIYKERNFVKGGKYDTTPCPTLNTEALMLAGCNLVRNGKSQKINDCMIYSNEEYSKFAIHYGAGTWIDGERWKRKGEYRDTWLKRYLRKPEKFEMIEKKFGKKGLSFYTFIAYDLLEVGPIYYMKRLLKKIIRESGNDD